MARTTHEDVERVGDETKPGKGTPEVRPTREERLPGARPMQEESVARTVHAPGWARVGATSSLVAGIIGVGIGWLPFIGRAVRAVCALVALVAGVVGVRWTVAAERAGRHAVAIAGLTLGFVCLFEAIRMTGCSALTGAATDAVTNTVTGIVH